MSSIKKTSASITKSIGKSVRNGWKTLKRLVSRKNSPNTELARELEALPDAPTNDVRATIRERNEFLEKVQRDLQNDIKKQEARKKQLQDISQKIRTLKTRDNQRLSNMEKQEKITELLKKTGFSIQTDAKTLASLKKLPSPPKKKKSYKIPVKKTVQFSDEYMEKEIGNEPVPYLSYIQTYRKAGRKGLKKTMKKSKN
jgi:hypothetical protein